MRGVVDVMLGSMSILLAAATLQAGTIGVYSAATCDGNSSAVDSGQKIVLQVVANTLPGPDWGSEIDGAEYRILGVPAGWQVTTSPGSAVAVSIGNPVGDGVDVAFMAPVSGCIVLHTLTLVAASAVEDAELTVVRHVDPSPPFGWPRTCPWMHYPCGGPCDVSGTCADAISHTLNPRVGVETTTWSRVRMLYAK